jgi:hypothetical protein
MGGSMDYKYLRELGIENVDDIETYSLRTEKEQDVLKVYYQRKKGDLFHRSEKFKFHRSRRRVPGPAENEQGEISEVSPLLTKVLAELDSATTHNHDEKEQKERILSELLHLERVVENKLQEIRQHIERL